MNENNTRHQNLVSCIAEIQLQYSNPVKRKDRIKISTSADAYNVLKENWSESIELLEEFVILLLDRSNRVLGTTIHQEI